MARTRAVFLGLALLAGCGDDAADSKWKRAAVEAEYAQRLGGLFGHAYSHARATFQAFDPRSVPPGRPLAPPPIVADLMEAAKASEDPMVAAAARKYAGFKYVVTFEDDDLAVPGACVVARIEIFDPSGREASSHKVVLTRSAAPPR
jgi:hypothetical protein